MTNVVNLSPKTTIFSEKALGLTTFVTTDQKSTQKTPWIDDVCNNTHPSTPKSQPTSQTTLGVRRSCGAHGQRRHHRLPNFARNLSWSFFETPQKRCNSNDANSMFEQVAGELRAKLMGGGRAWPDNEATRRATYQRPGAAGVEGAGGTGGHGRASRRGAERSEALASRAAGPSGARNTSGATSNNTREQTASRRAAAHGRTKQPGPAGHTKQPGPTRSSREKLRNLLHRSHAHEQTLLAQAKADAGHGARPLAFDAGDGACAQGGMLDAVTDLE